MFYSDRKDVFTFHGDTHFLEHLLSKLENGVIKIYPAFSLLEPIPEIIFPDDYDYIVIDGRIIPWEEMYRFDKDRIKNLVSGKTFAEKIVIENFYHKKYNPKDILKIFDDYPESKSLPYDSHYSNEFLGFNFINLRADCIH